MEAIDEIGFNCGWDHAEYGIAIPAHLMSGTIADGYQAGVEKRGRAKPKDADRYVRKWLQLRRNAWKRERIFDMGVTPEYLHRIEVIHCPITRVPLTYGTGEDTDWSVDRLVNDGGYVRGNLVMMSTGANRVKDAITTKDIVEKATTYDKNQKAFFLSSEPLGHLTVNETMRLYTLTMIPHAGDIMLASRVFVPPAVPAGQVYVLQCYLTLLSLLGTIRNDVKAEMRRIDPRTDGLQRVMRKITDAGRTNLRGRIISGIDKDGNVPFRFDDLMWSAEDVWLPGTGVYDEFHKWIWRSSPYQMNAILSRLLKLAQREKVGMALNYASRIDTASFEKRIGMASGGYVDS